MNRQLFLIAFVSGLFLSTALKSQQINTDFTSSLGGWGASGNAGLSLNTSTGMATLTNFNGTSYTTSDCRMIYTATMTFGGTSDRYILLKEQDIAGSANLMFQLRIGSNDYSVYAPSATGYSNSKPISRYVIPGTNTILCLGRVHQMYNASTQFPYSSNTSVSRMQYFHLPTSSGSPANTYIIDFVKSYLDSTAVFGSTEMDLAKYDIDFSSSTYQTGFSASPTTLTTDANNFILQSGAISSTDQAILTYQPSAPFLWTFSKQNVLVYKVNKNSITTNAHIKLSLTVPSTLSPYSLTTFEYSTPQNSSSGFNSNFMQINIPGSNDYFLVFNLDGLTCGTAGAPDITALKSQNACTATKLQMLLYGGLQPSEIVKVDYVKPFSSVSAAYTFVNSVVTGSAALNGAANTGTFSTTYGTESNSQSFYTSGCNLTSNLTITAPTGFDVSTNYGVTWGSSASFSQTSGIAGGIIKIKLKSTAAVSGNYNSQNFVISATGASSVNITTPSSGNIVSAKALTAISTPSASNKTYDGTTSATINGTFTGIVGSDAVNLTGSFSDAGVGTAKSVTASSTLGGAQASNYTYSGSLPTGLTADITAISSGLSSSNSTSNLTLLAGKDITVQSGVELTVDNTATIHSVSVAPGGKLTVNSGSSLTTGNLSLQSDATGTATFVDKNTNGSLTVTGSSTVQQYLNGARNWYISSPVNGSKAKSGFTFYKRDEVNNAWITMTTGDGITTGDPLNVGQGYIANLATGTATYTFTGTLNNGNQSITVNRTVTQAIKPGFNLAGNPYSSYLNAKTLVNLSVNLEKSIWYRTQIKNSSTYTFDTYNTVGGVGTNNSKNNSFVIGTVAPMQAFWVRVAQGQTSATLNYSNSYRTHATDTVNLLKSKAMVQSSKALLRLQVSNGTNSDEAVIYSDQSASDDYDIYDSQKISNNSASIAEIYTLAGTEDVAINGLNLIPYDKEIPLGFSTLTAGTYNIKASQISNFQAGTQIILKDYSNVNNSVNKDLSDGSSYSFTSDVTSNNTSRFSLIFRAPSEATGLSNTAQSDLWFSIQNNKIIVNGNLSTDAHIEVCNSLGQKIQSTVLTTSTPQLNKRLSAGVYLISLTNAGKTITKRVIID